MHHHPLLLQEGLTKIVVDRSLSEVYNGTWTLDGAGTSFIHIKDMNNHAPALLRDVACRGCCSRQAGSAAPRRVEPALSWPVHLNMRHETRPEE